MPTASGAAGPRAPRPVPWPDPRRAPGTKRGPWAPARARRALTRQLVRLQPGLGVQPADDKVVGEATGRRAPSATAAHGAGPSRASRAEPSPRPRPPARPRPPLPPLPPLPRLGPPSPGLTGSQRPPLPCRGRGELSHPAPHPGRCPPRRGPSKPKEGRRAAPRPTAAPHPPPPRAQARSGRGGRRAQR